MGPIESSTRVLFGDTDALGIVYYANYLRFFEIGRAEWFRALDRPPAEYIAQDAFLIVIEAGVRYHKPAVYDQVLKVRTVLSQVGRARLRFDYTIVPDVGDGLIASGFTEHAIVDRTGRVRRFTKDFRERMEALKDDGLA